MKKKYLSSLVAPIINYSYPTRHITDWHYIHHIKGITGSWMDKPLGAFHRITNHHLIHDGYIVINNKQFSLPQFLHHIGLDSLTARGIPNPLLPHNIIYTLKGLGFSHKIAYELSTINMAKLLSGIIPLAIAINDGKNCIDNKIPLEWENIASIFGGGIINIIIGIYLLNTFLILAGVVELGVGGITIFRKINEKFENSVGEELCINY
jgi:hypothetical protein